MPDTSTDDGFSALLKAIQTGAQTANTIGTNNSANAVTQAAYAAIIKNLQDRFGDYKNLSPADYQSITAQKLGPSDLGSIPTDAQSRASQQAAIAQLDDIAKSGGLDLSDMNALNEVQSNLNRNNSAREQGLANQYAARGQLGSGAQLAMDLANQQSATTSANAAGETQAADAQKRAMQAVLSKAQASRTMSQDDYAKKAAAAQANDSINAHNAAFATDASKYNNSLQGQTYNDALAKLTGEGNVTGQLNTALLGSGQQNANTALANGNATNQAIGAGGGIVSSLFPKSGSTPKTGDGITYSPGDTPTNPIQKTSDNDNLQPDPTDPQPTPDPEPDIDDDGFGFGDF